jgi:hypothetical protein
MLGPLGEDIGLCADDGYCLDGNAMNDGSLGTCTARAQVGQPCTAHPPGTPCVLDARCEGGVCIPDAKRKQGESCEQAECDVGLFCDKQVCQPSTLTDGAICGLVNGNFVEGECAVGLHCTSANSPSGGTVCRPLPTENQSCPDDVCAAGLACDRPAPNGGQGSGVCRAPRGQGEACGFALYDKALICQPGLQCRANVCQLPCQ